MLALRRGGCGCSRRGLPNPTTAASSVSIQQRLLPQQRLPRLLLRALSSGKPPAPPPEVDAEERAAWRRQFMRPGHHHRSHTKKPPPVLARLDPAGIAVDGEGGVRAFEGASYELRFGDHVLVMGGNGDGKSLFWQALGGKRRLGEEGGGDDVGGSKALMYMSFNMHERFLEQHGQRVVADVLGGASDPLVRRLIVTLGLYPLWYVTAFALFYQAQVVVWLLPSFLPSLLADAFLQTCFPSSGTKRSPGSARGRSAAYCSPPCSPRPRASWCSTNPTTAWTPRAAPTSA